MGSLPLSVSVRVLAPLLLVVSIFLLLRGHDEPGGGFSGALVGAMAATLLMLANGIDELARLVPVHPRWLIAVGLALAIGSGVPAMLGGEPLLSGAWLDWKLPVGGGIALGTPLLFDLGVYLITGAAMLLIVATVARG